MAKWIPRRPPKAKIVSSSLTMGSLSRPEIFFFYRANFGVMFDLFSYQAWLLVIIFGCVYCIYARCYGRKYIVGLDSFYMDPVSASMLLSEIDPKRHAQVNIVSVVTFEEKLRFVDFRNRFVDNVISTDPDSRFAYRMDCTSSYWPMWRKATEWHPFDNFKLVKQPQTSLLTLVSRRLTEPLSMTRPPWECIFVESYKKTEDSPTVSAIILTMHHCMGDGFTLCHQLVRRCAPAHKDHTMHHCYPFTVSVSKPKLYQKVLSIPVAVLALLKLIFLRPDPSGPHRNKRLRRIEDVMLCQMVELPQNVADLKRIARKTNTTLNDVVVAGVSIALSPKHSDITSAIWVGLNRKSPLARPHLREHDWGNANLGTCYMQIPKVDAPRTILAQVHERLAAMKRSSEPMVANLLLKVLGSLPTKLLWPFRHLLMDKMSTSISNFPGPVERVCMPTDLNGVASEGTGTVDEVFFLVAPPFSYGPYVTVMSYANRMFLAVIASENLMSQSDINRLVREDIPTGIAKLAF